MKARAAIVVFPGSNCEHDVARALSLMGADPVLLWHTETTLPGVDIVVLPGGFAHGDYLRTGALAALSPIMGAVKRHAGEGGLVIGICNGFQILCEARLLPGALRKNKGLKFICRWVDVRVDNADTPFTSCCVPGQVLRIPINHFEGNYVCDPATLERLQAQDQVVFRYVDNPNGSLDDIAGICSEGRNVVGLMPHPERASDPVLGSADGLVLLRSLLAAASAPGPVKAR